MYDVIIIGAGVTGAFIARELSRYEVKTLILERCSDVAMGSTKANSAIVHAGYDAKPGSLKAKLNVRGTALMEQVCKDLDVPFKRIGSFVIAFNDQEEKTLGELLQRGLKNGVQNLSIISGEEARSLEPQLSNEVTKALYARDAGIVCPYELTIGAVENAVDNGVELKLESEVKEIEASESFFTVKTQDESYKARYVINAAGLYSDAVAGMIGDKEFSIDSRKGEYLLFDKSQGGLANKVIFQAPTKKGKGILVTPTVDGNLLVGPTAEDVPDKEDISTSEDGLKNVIQSALKSLPKIQRNQVITSFAGLRAKPSCEDFVIRPSNIYPNFIHAAGIESPGLSSAPAIGQYVIEILRTQGLALVDKQGFIPTRKGIPRVHEMTPDEINELVKKNPGYGRIICRCERITEGEVVESIHRAVGATTLDGVKRRTRSGMGRCQGGFCSPRIVEIIARELGVPMDQVTKTGGKSRILAEKTKKVGGESLERD